MRDVREEAGGPVTPQRFFIGCRLPGLNEILAAARSRNRRGSWSRYDEIKTMYESMIKADIKRAKLKPCAGTVRIALHWVEPNARRDFGNIRTGEKFISDALVSLGILKTDARSQVVGFVDTFAVDPDHPGVWVTLERP